MANEPYGEIIPAELEADLRAEYDLSLADFGKILDDYRNEGFGSWIKPFYGTK